MIPLYSTKHIRALDSFAIKRLNVTGNVLMENAAIGISEILIEKFGNKISSVGIFCGKGNNGGDGFAVARHLSNFGLDVKILYLGKESEMSADCKQNFIIAKKLASFRKNILLKRFTNVNQVKWLKNCDLIIDAILGSGFNGSLKNPLAITIKNLNRINALKCAIDIPTGLNSDTGHGDVIFKSDLTVTLGEFKPGLFVSKGSEYCGEVLLSEIGIGRDFLDVKSSDTFLIEPEDVFENFPNRGKRIHKYSAGKVLTIAGSYDMPGAAALTSNSAFKVGAGSSILAIPDSAKSFVHKKVSEVVVEAYGNSTLKEFNSDSIKSVIARIKWADVVAIGPGLGRVTETVKAVRLFLMEKKFKFAVLDADALFAISRNFYKKIDLQNCILTPHLGEFSQLISLPLEKIEKDILKYGRSFAVNNNCTLILKGAPTIIFLKNGEAIINTSGNSGLAKFGSGDVLTGMISGLLAQNKDPNLASVLAVYLHGLAADLLIPKRSIYSITAEDLINNIPSTFKFLIKSFAS